MTIRGIAGLALSVLLSGCAGDGTAGARFDLEGGFFDAPWPILGRDRTDGTLRVSDFPNPSGTLQVRQMIEGLERDPAGFSLNTSVFLPMDVPLDPATLPPDGVADGSVRLVDIDPDSPERGRTLPVWTSWRAEPETFAPGNLLALIPRPGIVLRPRTLYAAYATDAVRAEGGGRLSAPAALRRLLRGQGEEPLASGFAALGAHLAEQDLDVVAATVFRTGDPYTQMITLRDHVREREVVASDLAHLRSHDGFTVIEGSVDIPLLQDGERPYSSSGGRISVADGAPATEREEAVRFALTVPTGRPMPEGGFPILLYSAGLGGAYTQGVDRGTFAEQDAEVLGRGPAWLLADVGIATISIEAPLVGPRHPTGNTSGLEFFNFTNMTAFRDNTVQAVVDFVVLSELVETLRVPGATAPELAEEVFFDPAHKLFWGHSTGATVGTVYLGLDETVEAGILSGIGGLWTYNLSIKQEPLDIGVLVGALLGYRGGDGPGLFDPELMLAQTLWEPTEATTWARRWTNEPLPGAAPKHVLVVEGVVDGFFPPPSVNALAIAAEAELVEPRQEESLADALAEVGRMPLSHPADGAEDGSVLLFQETPAPGVDGHYVPFDEPAPKHRIRCWAQSVVQRGRGRLPSPSADPLGPCE